VQIRAAIALLILAQFRRVHEEAVPLREQYVARRSTSAREAQHRLVGEHQAELRPLGANVVAELEPQTQARITLGENGRRCIAMNRPVIARE
jgi:hypothetical protein